jgi:nucleoside-diphosphate-sugar epimerase
MNPSNHNGTQNDRPRRLLITGATGFIGSHAVESAVACGFRVFATARSSSPELMPDVEYRQADLFDAQQVADLIQSVRPTHLLHTAWLVIPSECWFSPDNHRWVEASKVLLRAFVEAGGRRAVFTGSCAEYDWTTPQPCDEKTTLMNSQTLYGRCKNELREWALQYARQSGTSFAWGRPFFLYGPREHPDRLFPAVIRSLLDDKPVACTAGTQQRDFLYVEDAANGLLSLLQSDLGDSVNIASGHAVALRDVIERVAVACGKPELVQFGARPTPAFEPPLLVANISRQSDELRWSPAMSLASGLDATIRWWQNQRIRQLSVNAKPLIRKAS